MKKNLLYRQCRLVKRLRDGEMIQTSYIPAEFARVNRVVKLRDDDGAWDDGWVVRLVGNELHDSDLDDLSHAQRRFARETAKD